MNSKILEELDLIINNQENFKPHKILAILSIIKLFRNHLVLENKIFYNNDFKNYFTEYFKKYSRENDRNRSYAPFFHLKSHFFWNLKAKEGKEFELKNASSVGGPGQLNELVDYAFVSEDFLSLLKNSNENILLEKYILNGLDNKCIENSNTEIYLMKNNEFITYINSLHCIDANSDGALAEAQARNPLFHDIHVKHPWARKFAELLNQTKDSTHIILTGHAGDGKSTIALELYKILTHTEDQAALTAGLPKRTDVTERITIVKDLSEWTNQEQDRLFEEMATGHRRFVLISNTGCLLNLFKRHAKIFERTAVMIEDDLLSALDSSSGEMLKSKSCSYAIFNLARVDNIDTSLELLRKIVNSSRWDECDACSLSAQCPLSINRQILKKYQERVFSRLRLLLRRMVDYGHRLTMRQLSALFAYMLTSGSDCTKVANVLNKKQSLPLETFMFFNRFWGDNGWRSDENASQLKSTRVIAEQGFGTTYAPTIERLLWLQSDQALFNLEILELNDLFAQLLAVAQDPTVPNHFEARAQIRRMLYFFRESSPLYNLEPFFDAFLNSPMLREHRNWIENPSSFSKKRSTLKEQLFHVLQEQFSGIKLPEGMAVDRTLYITLNRRQHNIRQSSQIMLGKLDFSEKFDLKVVPNGESHELALIGKGEFSKVKMSLALPFLDYLFARKSGGIGSILQVAYVDRLENLKSEILRYCPPSDAEELLLLKLDANHQLRRQRVTLDAHGLEVSNG